MLQHDNRHHLDSINDSKPFHIDFIIAHIMVVLFPMHSHKA